MSSGSTKTSTQSTSPWPQSVPYLEDAMKSASNKIENKVGFNSYPGQTWTDYSPQTLSGLSTTEQLASQPNPFYQPNADFTQGLVAGQYNPNAIAQYGTGIASGAQGITTEDELRNLYNNSDANFNEVLDTQSGKLSDDIARTFGGASFGSAASTGALTEQVGDARNKAATDYYFALENQKRGLLGDITGVQGQNITNQLAAAGMLSGEQQLGTQNQMAGVGLSDQVYQSQYAPAERMLGVGAAYDAKAAEQLQSEMDKYNIDQQAGWNRLAAAWPYYSGTGGSQTTTTQPTDPWSKILGGGLLASQALSTGGLLNQSGNLFGSSGTGMY